jgi:hypothetical protein
MSEIWDIDVNRAVPSDDDAGGNGLHAPCSWCCCCAVLLCCAAVLSHLHGLNSLLCADWDDDSDSDPSPPRGRAKRKRGQTVPARRVRLHDRC